MSLTESDLLTIIEQGKVTQGLFKKASMILLKEAIAYRTAADLLNLTAMVIDSKIYAENWELHNEAELVLCAAFRTYSDLMEITYLNSLSL